MWTVGIKTTCEPLALKQHVNSWHWNNMWTVGIKTTCPLDCFSFFCSSKCEQRTLVQSWYVESVSLSLQRTWPCSLTRRRRLTQVISNTNTCQIRWHTQTHTHTRTHVMYMQTHTFYTHTSASPRHTYTHTHTAPSCKFPFQYANALNQLHHILDPCRPKWPYITTLTCVSNSVFNSHMYISNSHMYVSNSHMCV